MQACEKGLQSLVRSLPPRPISKEILDSSVADTLSGVQHTSSPENRRITWEYVLRNEIFTLAATEGQALKDPNTKYYDDLRDRLDLVLTFTEHDVCDTTFPFYVLYDLLETQTIASCSHIFSWIEERADRLTEGLVPQKGKALVLLRTLNDLLRRLSKMGSTTKFCGRILTFLSRVFPLGERSGVNLRGEYGPVWEGPVIETKKEEEDVKMETTENGSKEGEKMQVDEPKKEEESKPTSPAEDKKQGPKDDFYHTFWSLQLPFSRPPLFAEHQTFTQFKEAVSKVLPVIKEATAKERALMGSKTSMNGSASLKRKREPEGLSDIAGKDYFFAKYLTSPDLLELEIADTHFRRQFIFQLLILLTHLLTFTKAAKAEWSTLRNRSLHMDFTLEPSDAQWVQETITKANEELRQTTPNGRAFAETVHVILEREKNWIKWKNELCASFDKEAWSTEIEVEDEKGRKVKKLVGLEEATREARKNMRADLPEWEHSLGTAPLTEIWEMGYRDLSDLQHPFQAGDVKDFVKKIKQEDARMEIRKKQLTRAAERVAQARAKAAVSAAASTSSPASPSKSATSTSQDTTAQAPAAARSAQVSGATGSAPPLHHPLPAKPGTSPVKLQPESTPTPVTISTPTPAPVSAPGPAAPAPEPVLPSDEQITKYQENKQRWAWLALRTARDHYLQHFGKIGTGDIILLAQEIEKEQKEREERALRGDTASLTGQEDRAASPMIGSSNSNGVVTVESKIGDELQTDVNIGPGRDGEGDVKMEG